MAWLQHLLGEDGGSLYNLYSGLFPFLFSFGVLGTWYTLWKRHNCHVSRCHRIGRREHQPEIGAPVLYCRKHHPLM